jgi:hypothetical protein
LTIFFSFPPYFLYFLTTRFPHFFSLSDGESWPLYAKCQQGIRNCSLKKTPISKTLPPNYCAFPLCHIRVKTIRA